MAARRLMTLTKKLKSMKKMEEYVKGFYEWREEGVISKISKETLKIPGHFFPHHPVFIADKLTTSKDVLGQLFDRSRLDSNK